MKLCLGIALALLALFFAASGTAAVTRGWVLPTNRRHVRRPQLYGWGQWVMAIALCCQAVFGLVINDIGTRQWGTLTGSVLLLGGIIMLAVSHGTAGPRRQGGAP
jgi:drug/metabolite transporter (DMT)-like permease